MSKIGAFEANSPLQKRFCDFSQRGYVFRSYLHYVVVTRLSNYIVNTLRFPNPLSAILENLFSIRFKLHLVVIDYLGPVTISLNALD